MKQHTKNLLINLAVILSAVAVVVGYPVVHLKYEVLDTIFKLLALQ